MSKISSINFKKSVDFQVFHNSTVRPNYAIGGELIANRKGYEALKIKNQIIEEAKEAYTKNTKQKFQAKSYEWSAVCNIKPETTMADLERLAEHFEQKYGFQCYQIAIHRDEGHLDDDGNKVINHHAHLEFVTLDKETGKNMYRREIISPKILRQIQTEVAEILGMERGQDKRISKRERVEPRKYAQIKEQERKTQKELKAELEQEKLSKAELKKELEQLRKDSKDQGYTKEYFQEINREKKLLRFNTKNDFEKWVQELTEKHTKKSFWSDKVNNEAIFEDMYKSYQDQSNILQELEAKVKYLEAKNNNEETISTLKTDFKAKLFDEAYNDISKEVDLSRLYYNKEQKIIINKSQNWEIKDNNTQLVSKKFTPESVAIMIKLAQKKGWDLEQLEITGSKEFKAEVAKQIKEIKEQEKKAEIERARAEFEAQIQSILEQSKAEKEKIKRVHYNEIDEIITKKNQEIQAQNQEISAKNKRIQELETRLKQEQNKELEAESKQSLQENWKASEERQERILDKLDNQLKQEQQSQAQIDLNFINKIENQIFIDNNDDIYRLYSILGRYKLIEQQEYLKTKLREPMIATPNDYIRNAKEKILSTIKQENKPSLEDIENKEKELFLKVLSMTTKDMVKKDSEKQNQQRGWSR